ncbi:Crp/Fnr family transcriptional regulator [Hyphomicrobium denitrificans 1NES1]|uniref:Crp/Fnr family transcriptional regulator n=1 Tax=Hyphomicrobium denitrificans 1NES1 TaxID=670307 RepID=N0B8D6_9HYPH|nr:helix-turn-helix domain-containing protein [Hyphomicrobium denitrificans]AGK56816.1 Crp/Fnr family transcriptional regulator [Hyphomicrobium denitrificans 1NES1]
MLGATGVHDVVPYNPYAGLSSEERPCARQRDGFENATFRKIGAKEYVFCDGDPRTHIFYVEQGVIALSKILGDGRRQVIDFAYPGDYIGLGLLKEYIFDAQATCLAKVKCIPASALEQAAASDPDLALKLYKAVSAELTTARNLLVCVGQGTAMERIAMFLVRLRNRAAISGANDGVFSLLMRRSDIADLLGLTIETVSRTLTKLRGMHVIDIVNATEIHVLDEDKLEQLAA